jgi:hypothetical protein
MSDFNQHIGDNIEGDKFGGDKVARDKITQNIILVGQLLEFANVEQLFPKLPVHAKIDDIISVLKASTNNTNVPGSIEGVAFAGEILKDVFNKHVKTGLKNPYSSVKYTEILSSLPGSVYQKLVDFGYWDNFSRSPREQFKTRYLRSENRIIALISLDSIWKKYFNENFCFYIYGRGYYGHGNLSGTSSGISVIKEYWFSSELIERFEFTSSEQARVFIVGIVIDLIRMYSIVSQERVFWKNLTDMLANKNLT